MWLRDGRMHLKETIESLCKSYRHITYMLWKLIFESNKTFLHGCFSLHGPYINSITWMLLPGSLRIWSLQTSVPGTSVQRIIWVNQRTTSLLYRRKVRIVWYATHISYDLCCHLSVDIRIRIQQILLPFHGGNLYWHDKGGEFILWK